MSVKLFYETHGRFPTQQEFRLLKESAPPKLIPADNDAQGQFVKACQNGERDRVKELLQTHGTRLLQGQWNNYTGLCAAAQRGHMEIVKDLLDAKADPDFRAAAGRTPILFAAESGHFDVMNLLINRGATMFTAMDQQLESYFVSYMIRQAIIRRDVMAHFPSETLVNLVLEFLGLGSHRVRPHQPVVQYVPRENAPAPAGYAAAAAPGVPQAAAAAGQQVMPQQGQQVPMMHHPQQQWPAGGGAGQ